MRHIECDSFWLLSHSEWHSHLILLSGWWCFVAITTVAMVVDVLGRCFYSFCIWIVVLIFCIWVCLPFGGLLMRWLNLNGSSISSVHRINAFFACIIYESFHYAMNCCFFQYVFISVTCFLSYSFIWSYFSAKCWHHVYVPIQLAIQSEHLRFKKFKRISSERINEKS